MAVFEGEKLSTNIVNNGTMSDEEVVASDVPPQYLLPVIFLCINEANCGVNKRLLVLPSIFVCITQALCANWGANN